ncbi:DUF1659 domain-containing protein [Priestia koreensis]|uniref:DUF1659 domain-containing protein n=1 Tax=Priestia koreensis TaxID=284581 RepID=A0A0M0L5Q4_9BACI|nr:DUF1659 domain-containing protein [Priestia koreensis]KOO46202.1 hypothetical protein AMD01_10075 [Priestia koreensis]MCM3004254.1 DUF1659 domain-containing protein [Priestia koreensis]
MAAKYLVERQIRLVFDQGVNAEGKPVYKSKTIRNIASDATPEQMVSVAQALESLQSLPLNRIESPENYQISVN